jgi:transcription antitermination factor NusG
MTGWYAIRVRREREFSVAALLTYKGYEIFLPQYRGVRRAAEHAKERSLALFPGYLFCRIQPDVSGNVLTTPGVIAFVNSGRTAVEVDPEEIEALQRAISCSKVQPWPYAHTGQRVRIMCGPLRGIEGVFMRFKNESRLVISITLLQRSAAIEIDRAAVSPAYDTRGPVLDTAVSSQAFELR